MNDLEFKQQELDTKSASFCAAKWYNATIWLGSGMTTSCHHPLPHKIDVEAIRINPAALHNTHIKKEERKLMQEGTRTAGCDYCWKIEDLGSQEISDRVYKSKIYSKADLDYAFNRPYLEDVNLRTLEIAFDRTCQFACSYCNPAFSTTWVNDIKKNGHYTQLLSDGRNHFTHTHDSAQLYKYGEPNPYVEAFFKWWETDLHRTLTELRITGGEPLMSAETWKLIEWFKLNQNKSKTKLAINSNLGFSKEKLNDFIEAIRPLPHVELYTSCEATTAQAEYIRDGLDYAQWFTNMRTLAESKTVKALHVMCTINALCLETLPKFLDNMMELKALYGRDFPSFSINILRFPSFQGPLVLPYEIRSLQSKKIAAWLDKYRGSMLMHEHEINQIVRLSNYLELADSPNEIELLQGDFKKFYMQYDRRRNKDFMKTFPALTNWYNRL